MRAGQLRDRIAIYKPEIQVNPETGSRNEVRELVLQCKANIMPRAGGVQTSAEGLTDMADAMISFRYQNKLKTIDSDWIIIDRDTGREYEIDYLDPITSRTREIKAECRFASK